MPQGVTPCAQLRFDLRAAGAGAEGGQAALLIQRQQLVHACQ